MIPGSFQFLMAVAVFGSPEAFVGTLQGAAEVRVHRVQLDGDAELEAVVQYEVAGSGVYAVVLDQRGGEWREVARFNSWWNYERGDYGTFLEFRAVAEAGVQDVIVRVRSGGTEAARRVMEVFRLREGTMRSVLSVVEEETAMEHPSGDVFATAARVRFAGVGRVEVRSVRNPGGLVRCRVFVWDGEGFGFKEDPGAAVDACR